MTWKRPEATDIKGVIAAARRRVVLCSPFITAYGISVARSGLPHSVEQVEIWTRMELRDWVAGASDPDAVLDFVDTLPGRIRAEIYTSSTLHAKFVLSDETLAWAGSSNLTSGGLGNNIELGCVIRPPEIQEILSYVRETRGLLSPTSPGELRNFVTECQRLTPDREALLDLVREVAPPTLGRRPLVPLTAFIKFIEPFSGETADNIRTIYSNKDGNNRTGHLKQAYYGVQRFLQEYPRHLSYLAGLPAEAPFDLRSTAVEQDWRDFVTSHDRESDIAFGYDLSILVSTYLTQAFGGRRIGGGGGDYPFKIVWPLLARMMIRLTQ